MNNEAYLFEKQENYRFVKNNSLEQIVKALSEYADKILFLDIETTGLSKIYSYITMIGWMFDDKYDFYIRGSNIRPLEEVLEKAKLLITFNGSMFDVPFLKKEIPDLRLPRLHFDLRFFSKRFGFSGGQKRIEKILQIERPSSIKNISGKEAVSLWYQYLNNNEEALKKLILYNNYDIIGMQKILNKLNELYVEPNFINKIKINDIQEYTERNIELPMNIYKKTLETVKIYKFYELFDMNKLKDLSVIGIDLTGSEEKPSGCCYLKGNFAQTCMIKSNEEIYKYILENKPTLVSLDSPLSLPKGRNTAFDDDINRKKYGITRLCERELMKRGVKVYPSLINSMQKLTTRGIKIANYLRKRGIPVIESYPGAAQDVLHIPRKKTDLSLLKNGLIDFGLDIEKDVICHDEVDAITSALVGYFFWQGNYEALGNEDENFLIIPDLRKERVSKHKILVIGFSGPICSGKTTASYFLKNSGFAYLRFSLILEKILINQKIKKSRENLQKLGNHVFEKKGQYWLCKKLIKSIKAQNNIVIDGLRHPEDYTFFVERYGADFKLIFIDSSLETRLKRIRDFNPEKYLDYINHKSENDVKQLLGLSSIKITNEYNMETFKKDILDLMEFEE